jgi:hypothetical protein
MATKPTRVSQCGIQTRTDRKEHARVVADIKSRSATHVPTPPKVQA